MSAKSWGASQVKDLLSADHPGYAELAALVESLGPPDEFGAVSDKLDGVGEAIAIIAAAAPDADPGSAGSVVRDILRGKQDAECAQLMAGRTWYRGQKWWLPPEPPAKPAGIINTGRPVDFETPGHGFSDDEAATVMSR